MKFLIAGLGNPGEEYANTRHNIGFVVADALAAGAGARFKPERYAGICRLRYKRRTMVVIKPSTFMNLSGKSVRYWLQKEDIPAGQLLVVVDDIALPTGVVRLRMSGSDGGHNGLQSIIEMLGTTEFPRLRIGIGSDFAKGYQVDWVLGKWTRDEEEIMIPRVELAVEVIKSFVAVGAMQTMSLYNSR
ncbi:MAG: aminoacyl-tRNA hydrolase [Bacteroidales bacterium]|nr:aminoacyl-tRNA hydrolase [Bacteroidales bacterium]